MDRLLMLLIDHLRRDSEGIARICNSAESSNLTAGKLLEEYRKHGLAMERDIVALIGTPLEKHAHKKGEL